MGAQPPFLYEAEKYGESRFPTTTFDPKAVTRASWEPKPKKPKQNGPLLSFNRHPDLQEAVNYRSSNYTPMSRRTKQWIVWMRWLQLGLRVLEMNGAIGLLVLMILMTNIDNISAWVLRITAGVATVHCGYGIYHLYRPAGGRTPSSSAAYQLFAGLSDICVMPLYAFGAVTTQKNSGEWSTRVENKDLLTYFVRAFYYLLISAGGLHFMSLCLSLWLGLMFRKITLMPPDMNPLEDHLTSRVRHKKNKSSVSTTYTNYTGDKRMSTPLEDRRRSGHPYEDVARPPTIPFMHTRAGSVESMGSSRDSRVNLPSRQYQITPGNSPRNSGTSTDFKRMSMPVLPGRSSNRGSYTEVPLHEAGSFSSRPRSGIVQTNESPGYTHSHSPRVGKFTETWSATDSLISRTQERNRALNAAALEAERQRASKSYEALTQRYGYPDSDSEFERDENNLAGSDFEDDLGGHMHPNPLRSNPPTPKGTPPRATPPRASTPPRATPPRAKTPYFPFRSSALSEVDLNDRRVSGSRDIVDEKPLSSTLGRNQRYRNSSIQPESDFFSKPYGDLKPATPPIMVGSGRQVSSGHDYEFSNGKTAYGRRNVSGKTVEEGRAGRRFSRHGRLDE